MARSLISDYTGKSGKCADSEEVRVAVMEVVERALHMGAYGNVRKWVFHACNGCFTAPKDLQVPLKVKIDGYPERVWGKWYEFHEDCDMQNSAYSNGCGCGKGSCNTCGDPNSQSGLHEDPNTYYTCYDIPDCGAFLVAVPKMEEDCDAHFLVQGLDMDHRDIYIPHEDEDITGHRIDIARPGPSKANRSKVRFSKITGLYKTKTVGYVRLYWYNPDTKERGLLGEYAPGDTNISLRRFNLKGGGEDCCTKISVLGRVATPDYHNDNDILPITNINLLKKIAQMIQAEDNDQIVTAGFKKELSKEIIMDENEYNRTGDEGFQFDCWNSPGSIDKGVI